MKLNSKSYYMVDDVILNVVASTVPVTLWSGGVIDARALHNPNNTSFAPSSSASALWWKHSLRLPQFKWKMSARERQSSTSRLISTCWFSGGYALCTMRHCGYAGIAIQILRSFGQTNLCNSSTAYININVSATVKSYIFTMYKCINISVGLNGKMFIHSFIHQVIRCVRSGRHAHNRRGLHDHFFLLASRTLSAPWINVLFLKEEAKKSMIESIRHTHTQHIQKKGYINSNTK